MKSSVPACPSATARYPDMIPHMLSRPQVSSRVFGPCNTASPHAQGKTRAHLSPRPIPFATSPEPKPPSGPSGFPGNGGIRERVLEILEPRGVRDLIRARHPKANRTSQRGNNRTNFTPRTRERRRATDFTAQHCWLEAQHPSLTDNPQSPPSIPLPEGHRNWPQAQTNGNQKLTSS